MSSFQGNKTRFLLVFFLFLIVAVAQSAFTQTATTGSIAGIVKDASGAVVPGVTVTAVNEPSGTSFVSVTDERGQYRIPVRAGVFKVTAELAGFTTAQRTGVTMAFDDGLERRLRGGHPSLQVEPLNLEEIFCAVIAETEPKP